MLSKITATIDASEKKKSVTATKIVSRKMSVWLESKKRWKLPATYSSADEIKSRNVKSVMRKRIFCMRYTKGANLILKTFGFIVLKTIPLFVKIYQRIFFLSRGIS